MCWTYYVDGIIILITIAIIINGINKHEKKMNSEYRKYRERDCSLIKFSAERNGKQNEIKEKIKLDINKINQRLSQNGQTIIAKQNDRTQTRLSFIALMAGLLVAFFIKQALSIELRFCLICISVVLFVFFYYFDIHIADLVERQVFVRNCFNQTIDKLIEITASSNQYLIDNKKMKDLRSTKTKKTICRKICMACYPELSQIVFYFIPLIIILASYLAYPLLK